jgi:methyl-accepting chemotaxis protein
LLGFGVGIFFSFYLGTIIRKPLNRLAQQSSAIASGDLTVQITQETTEEIGQMASSFAAMKTNLQQTLSQFTEATAAVASASAEISASTEQMAAGTQEQGQQATDVSSSVEQMSKTIHENSRNATRTVETANSAKQAAVHGGQVVQESITGMKRIASVVNKSAETVRALGQSSNQIGEIISVIDDIADQTNLLALNAAIEAARAGEQGRGFAVVADEVRKLAERTTKATKEITEMIKKIQHDTGDAVSSMEQGTREVEQGIKLADAAGSSLQTIVEISQKVTDMISQIAVASEQQAGASEEISKSVEGISNVAQETASGIQQIARTAEDLNRLTENLQQLIDRFKLTEERKGIQKPKATTRGPQSRVVVRENGHLVGHQSA